MLMKGQTKVKLAKSNSIATHSVYPAQLLECQHSPSAVQKIDGTKLGSRSKLIL